MDVLVAMRSNILALNRQVYLLLRDTYNDPRVRSQVEDKVIEQLQRGERGDGEVLPNYSPASVILYGKPPGPIKLFDQGDFYRGVTIEADPKGVTFYDTDPKTEMLVVRYGEEILELQDRSIDEVNEDVVVPVLQDKFLKYLQS